ncbi:MAG: UDP-glucose/GDP-mannose dehydrogenase family protein [Verrucomicrobiaceae bacterium]|nr:MAG: UDP-glucose/GDP-mannose dehydrogenase family protein [Verrucomicrobiaceae bacterium]
MKPFERYTLTILIGQKFLQAGPGYGGSCFPKDTLALLKTAQNSDSPMRVLEAVVAVNDCRKAAMARKAIRAMGGDVRGRKIAILGLTFKPNTDDMRDSPSIPLIQGLQDAGAVVHAFDPEGMEQARQQLRGVTYANDLYECATDAFGAIIVTEWDEFRAIDLRYLCDVMAEPVLIDLRNLYTERAVAAAGFSYVGIGQPMPQYAFSAATVPAE